MSDVPGRDHPRAARATAEAGGVRRRRPARRRLRRGQLVAACAVAVLGLVAAVLGALAGASTTVQGLALTVALLAAANAVWQVAAATPRSQTARPRRGGRLQATAAGAELLARRPALTRLALAAAGLLGLGALAGLARFGPGLRRPEDSWAAGVRLVTDDGAPLRPSDLAPGSATTVWPQGIAPERATAVMLLRLTTDPDPPTVGEWVADGRVVAYSKVCTHAGCPVGLFRASDNILHCPCHDAEFDAVRGARPVFGPAHRPLPQLPLTLDADGFLTAAAPFQSPVLPLPISAREQ